MKARTVSELIKEFCEENQYGDEVKDLLYFYWSEVRKAMVAKKEPSLFIVGLGEFTVNRKKLAQQVAKTYALIESMNNKDYKGFGKYQEIVDRLEVYKKLQSKAHDTVHHRNAFKQKLLNDRKDQNNLEEQVANS